jgi:hypothetical protein
MSSGGMAHGGSGSSAEAGATDTGGDGAGGSAADGGAGDTGGTGGVGGLVNGGGMSGSAVGGGGLADMGGRDGTAGSSAGNGGSNAGSAGGGGAPPKDPGIVCGPWDHTQPNVNCDAHEVCVLCEEEDTNRSVRCAPNPAEDPEGYATFSATCTNGLLSVGCDGPEDCPAGSVCQSRSDDDYVYAACSPEPPSCDAYCVACNSDADCSGDDKCVPNALGSGMWPGATCGPGLDALLPEGDWLIGWAGGLNHFSWFHFTADADDSRKGIVKTLPQECTACEAFGCESDSGTYEIFAENAVSFEFPEACAFSYVFTNLSSPPQGVSLASPVVVSAQVTVGPGGYSSAQALLYPPGVGCSPEFSVCTYPPP